MSCGGRVYKGDTVTISVPFDVDDYSNLTITYSTIGDEKIVLTEDEVEIEDGFITHTFQGHDLDLLPDGVIYYTIECDVLGVPNVDSTNTNLYLKTPAGYSGKTAEDFYQEGYEAGLEDCSGGTPCNIQLIKNVQQTTQYQSYSPDEGYDGVRYVNVDAKGYGDTRYVEGYVSGYTRATEVERSLLSAITITKNGTYIKARGGYNRVIVNVPSGETDCSEAFQSGYTEGYNSGYTAGLADCSGGTSCNLQDGYELYLDGSETAGQIVITPEAGYDGIANGTIYYAEAYQAKYAEGYAAGQEDCSGSTLVDFSTTLSEYWPGQQTFYPTDADGFRSVTIIDGSYGTEKYHQGYQSGYTAGFADAGTCDCTQSNAIAYNSGFTNGYDSGYTDGFVDGHSSGYTDGYNDGWDEGYNQGQELCPSCDIETGATFGLTSAFTGEVVYPTTGYAGMESIEIYDDGYGDAKYQEGYEQGYYEGADGCTDAITEAYESGYTYGNEQGMITGYYQGEQSVIKSFFAENDTDYVIAYYYNPTSAWMYYAITGVYMYNDGESYSDWVYGYCAFSAMSVNGGDWETPTLEYMLGPGWTQIRFAGDSLSAAFSMQATSAKTEPFTHLDGLKAVSLPSSRSVLGDSHTFTNNTSLKVLSSSLHYTQGDTFWGTNNLKTIFSHYKGDSPITLSTAAGTDGVFFYPEGYSSTIPDRGNVHSWTHMELF